MPESRIPEIRTADGRLPESRVTEPARPSYPGLDRREPARPDAIRGAATAPARREPQGSGSYQPPAAQGYLSQAPSAQSYSPLPPPGGMAVRSAGPDERPPLPQRTQQTHMAPQLQRSQSTGGFGGATSDETDFAPANPGLMAAYRRGVRAAEEQTGPSDE